MKLLAILASIIAAIAIWWVLFKFLTGLAVVVLAILVIGLPIGGLAYALYKFITHK